MLFANSPDYPCSPMVQTRSHVLPHQSWKAEKFPKKSKSDENNCQVVSVSFMMRSSEHELRKAGQSCWKYQLPPTSGILATAGKLERSAFDLGSRRELQVRVSTTSSAD